MVPPEDAAGAGADAAVPPASIALISSWDMVPPEDAPAAAGADVAAGAGAGSGSLLPPRLSAKGSKSRFAKPIDMMFMNSLFSLSSISSRKRTTTIPSSSGKYFSLKASGSPTSKDCGVEILTVVPRNSDKAVAEAPIIWFMTSQIALMWISVRSSLMEAGSSPIRVPTMMHTSSRRNIMIFLPSRPST